MSYSALDETAAARYLTELAALEPIWGPAPDLETREVGDGNLNQVFFATDRGSDVTLVLKQALPYLRVSGEDWPLTRERMRFETEALLLYNEVAPELVPTVHHHDPEMSLVVMEYLGEHDVMRHPVTRGERFGNFAQEIARFMARSHFFTSDAYLEGPAKKAKQKAFINPQLCELQEDFVFTNPLMTSPENSWNPALDADVRRVRRDAELKLAVNRTKLSYMTNAQALLHGDLHTGSIMVGDGPLKVIDPEFAFYGPQGYDVGTLFANLVLGAAAQLHHQPDDRERSRYQAYLLAMIPEIWEAYARGFDALWQQRNEGDLAPAGYWDFDGGAEAFARFRRAYLRDVLRDSARHGGCELLRRLMGIVSVFELTSIPDDEVRARAERQVIAVARAWLLGADAVEDGHDLARAARRALGFDASGPDADALR